MGTDGKPVSDPKAPKVADVGKDEWGKAVHLKDIHLEMGMQCVDCHFKQDNHGNGKIYGETRNAVEIDCVTVTVACKAYAKNFPDHLRHF